jgi:hypothetical protein
MIARYFTSVVYSLSFQQLTSSQSFFSLSSSHSFFPAFKMLLPSLYYFSLTSIAYGRVIARDNPALVATLGPKQINDTIIPKNGTGLSYRYGNRSLEANSIERPEMPPDPYVFIDKTDHLVISTDIDGPMKRDLIPRANAGPIRDTGRPSTDEPESRGDGKTGTSRFRETGE